MSNEMRLEVIKAAAQGYDAEEISRVLKLESSEVKTIIDGSQGEIKAEQEYRKGMH